MSKKDNLLTEAQVRKFMKLAALTPLTPGFIGGLSEDSPYSAKKEEPGEDRRKGAEKRGAEGTLAKTKGHGRVDYVKEGDEASDESDEDLEESHGRSPDEGPAGRGKSDQNARLQEFAGVTDMSGNALRDEDEGWDEENAEDDLEHAEDLEVDAEEDLGDVGGEEDLGGGGEVISVNDFLAALEVALEDVLGDEVEVDQEEAAEEEELEVPLEGGEELDVGLEVEEEPALQEMINKITKRVAKRIVREALQNKK